MAEWREPGWERGDYRLCTFMCTPTPGGGTGMRRRSRCRVGCVGVVSLWFWFRHGMW
jgi:hypothetical protein